ncbi:MAG: sterol desaturase family protein [Candidatus Marinimicrobia bacterium]|nr:sterol desaturase family protein [Candidatus Neomarinimicrobiota bacterium]MBL7010912.1 sterol desaturase family protein [Candidatus Neomarinimicrobiota bacterium]MBL7031348.1 sterol desaturase family protein [Candidatus Neomarinimicrobiota bacterium]
MLDKLGFEGMIRLGIAIGFFALLALWEVANPRRKLSESKRRRWVANLGIIFFNMAIVRLTVGAFAMSMAFYAQKNGWGLFNYLELPRWIVISVSIIILDFAIYLQHVVVHAVPIFWRVHRVHHTDLDIDVTSGLRFHPIEIVVSLIYKSAVVLLIGAPVFAVLIFEIILNGSSLFNHSNINISVKIDRWLRWILVTPDMHRIHHSALAEETNSNFGFSVSWWDRLCGTYKKDPLLDQLDLQIGLIEFRNQNELGLPELFIVPFRGKMGNYSFQKKEIGK